MADLLHMEITCTTDPSDRERLAEHFEALADAFYDVTGISDQSVGIDLARGAVEFSFDIEAESEIDAVICGYSAVRTAIHMAEGATPGWEDHITELVHRIEAADCVPA